MPTPTAAAQQRAAMQNLLSLSHRLAEEEAALRARLDEESSQIDVQFLRSSRKVEARRKRHLEAMEAEFARRAAAVETKHDADLGALRTQLDSQKERVTEESAKAHGQAKKELDHGTWAAESIYEAEVAQLNKQYSEIEKACENYKRNVEILLRDAGKLVQRYGQDDLIKPPPRDANAPPDPRPSEQAMGEEFRKVEEGLRTLRGLALAPWFTGFQPYVIGVLLIGGAAAGAFAYTGWRFLPETGIIGGLAAGFIILVLFALATLSKKQVRDTFVPLRDAGAAALEAADRRMAEAFDHRKQTQDAKRAERKSAVAAAKQKYEPILAEMVRRRDERLADLSRRYDNSLRKLEEKRSTRQAEAQAWRNDGLERLTTRYQTLAKQIDARKARRLAERDAEAAAERESMQAHWRQAWARVAEIAAWSAKHIAERYPAWASDAWRTWNPRRDFPQLVPFGSLRVDPGQIVGTPERPVGFDYRAIPSVEPVTLPAPVDLPAHGSMMWQHEGPGREAAIASMQAVMARLFTSLPPGRARMTIIDPVGLGQNFAGFMHLVDYEEDLVAGRIWTSGDQIEQRVVDLTDHMENVIQKYLRNEFETIDEYNAVAGELAEPYRFLVITDFPNNWTDGAAARLKSILSSGPRCGVYTLIVTDRRQGLPSSIAWEDLEKHSMTLEHRSAFRVSGSELADPHAERETRNAEPGFAWKDPVYESLPLSLDAPPDEETLTAVMRILGQAAKDSLRVEVPFSNIAPPPDQFWRGDSSKMLRVPVGRTGATRLQDMILGKDVQQHALLAGKTGSGKSTLLHVLVTNLAMWYSPDEVEFYLIDFKKGVEFKAYATHQLPHARAVAVESDREFGLSVLQRLDAEITRRGELYRAKGVQDLASYRQAAGVKMPRVLLVIDEFQEFFSEDDKIAQEAALLLDRLVRQGRAFGIHVILGSQTLAGTSNLPRSTIGNMAIRVALQTSDADAQLILSDDNTAARLLSRPGEAIYNDAGGLVEGNSPFQVSWLPDHEREQYLAKVKEQADQRGIQTSGMIVFEGNAPSSIEQNRALVAQLRGVSGGGGGAGGARPATTTTIYLGEAVAIKESTSALIRRQSGANILMVGQQEEAALGMCISAMLSVAAQHAPEQARFVILDGSPADAAYAGLLEATAGLLPHESQVVAWRDIPQAMQDLAAEAQRRQENNDATAPSVFVVVYALQRYRMLRKSEDDFGLSSFGSDEPPKPKPEKDFATLLREGPPGGVHVVTWIDTPTTLERTLDRQAIKEFDHRVLFQMSAGDSSNLIDSPAASNLGFFRALFSNEEQGVLEKFRPYGLPERATLEAMTKGLQGKAARAGA